MDNDATAGKSEEASGDPLAMQLRGNRVVDDVAHIPNDGGHRTPSAMQSQSRRRQSRQPKRLSEVREVGWNADGRPRRHTEAGVGGGP